MIKIKLILVDEDERYLKEARYAFMEIAPQLELITFTKKEKVYQYLEEGGTADLLVVDEKLVDEKLKHLASSMTRIALCSSLPPSEGFEVVKKYQRMETLLSDMLLKYAQDSGKLEAIRGDSNTKIASFYSPAGGTGKTTLALALATASARSGVRTLYLNLEEVDSITDILKKTSGGLSDIFLALKTKGMQVGIKLKESIGIEAEAGFHYVSGVESISEYEEMSSDDIKRLLTALREIACYDLVILDQDSGFTEKTKWILDASDVVFMPVTVGEGSISKLQRLLDESGMHGKYDSLFSKVYVVLNKCDVNSVDVERLHSVIGDKVPCCTGIASSPILAKRKNILRSGDVLLPIINPLLQTVMAGGGGADR